MQTRNLVKRTLDTADALAIVRELAAVAPHRTALAERVSQLHQFPQVAIASR